MIKFDGFSVKLARNFTLSYDVNFIQDLFNPSIETQLKELCQNRQAVVVVDKQVFGLYGQKIESYLKYINCIHTFFLFEAFEKNKTIDTVLKICLVAKNFQMKRDAIFIGIGGGITLDIVGFAASMFRRKTKYIRIPTTLVGQLDAGVGIKVGVNFNGSKNLLGSYYPPIATFNDQVFLKTLDLQSIRNGLYEIVKMGLVCDKRIFYLIEKYHKDFLKKKFNSNTSKIMYLSTLSMMKELEPNLHEHILKRTVDFGHTFSLYIEEQSNYSISHGEAVGIDIFLSSAIALRRDLLSQKDFDRIRVLVNSIGFTKKYAFTQVKDLYNSLQLVRNHRAGEINLVIPSKIGSHIFTNECSIDELQYAIDFYNRYILTNLQAI